MVFLGLKHMHQKALLQLAGIWAVHPDCGSRPIRECDPIDPAISTTPTLAQQQAERNFEANLEQLATKHPEIHAQMRDMHVKTTWLFGRDGALTAHDSTGTWWAGCSIPKRAAAEALKRVSVNGNIACFLAPTLAAQIAYALDRLNEPKA